MTFQPFTKEIPEKMCFGGVVHFGNKRLLQWKELDTKLCLIPGGVFKAQFRQMLRHEHMDRIGIEVTLARSTTSNTIQCFPADRRVLHWEHVTLTRGCIEVSPVQLCTTSAGFMCLETPGLQYAFASKTLHSHSERPYSLRVAYRKRMLWWWFNA